MTEINNVYKTIWKNRIKEYNEKCICYFTIWHLKSAITYKCGRAVLSRTSVYFAISKLILVFLHSFHVRCIILSNVYFYIYLRLFLFLHVPSFPFFLIDRNPRQVLLIKLVIFFLKLKNIFMLFSTIWKWSYTELWFDVDQPCETRRSK